MAKATRKTGRTGTTPTKRRKRRTPTKTTGISKTIIFVALCAVFWFGLASIENFVLNQAFNSIGQKPTQGDFAGNLIYNAINLHHSTSENKGNQERLLDMLNEPVKWYSAKERFHDQVQFGSPYDRFAYIGDLQFDHQNFAENNYEVRFNGMHRFRRPQKALVAFESGLVVIERGRISSLTSRNNPNAYHHNWINTLYRGYVWVALAGAFVVTLFLFNFTRLPGGIQQLAGRLFQRSFGL